MPVDKNFKSSVIDYSLFPSLFLHERKQRFQLFFSVTASGALGWLSRHSI